jgi:hypothetical protein
MGQRTGITETLLLSAPEPTAPATAEPTAPLPATAALSPAPATAAPPRSVIPQTHRISYSYDGLNRLTGAAETPGTTYYAYTDDLAGNRTEVRENDALVADLRYNDANQVIGWSYDATGNLLNDGTTTRSYDARNRLVAQDEEGHSMLRSSTYNGDGVLVSDGTTTYAQDLAAPLRQVLSDGTATYVYGQEHLTAAAGSGQTWYVGDALGSLRQTRDDAGVVRFCSFWNISVRGASDRLSRQTPGLESTA